VEERHYRPSLVGPLMLIGAGVVLLLNQAGLLPWNVWATLWRFWPVVLVLLGIEILVGVTRSKPVYLAALLLSAIILVGTVAYATYASQLGNLFPAGQTEQVVEAMHDADRGDVTLKLAAGTLLVNALQDSPNFLEGTLQYGRNSRQAVRTATYEAGALSFTLEAGNRNGSFWSPFDPLGERWELGLTPRVPIHLTVTSGAGDMQLDLTDLQVTDLELKGGAGRTSIRLPQAARWTSGSIAAGVGEIEIIVPPELGIHMRISKGLGAVRVQNPRMASEGEYYWTDGWDTAENRADLTIQAGVGAISIR